MKPTKIGRFQLVAEIHDKTEVLNPRHVAPNTVVGPTGIYIHKFPYDPNIPKVLNPEILMNNLKK